MIHDLKTLVKPFQALWDGTKSHEVRKFDRDFQVGHTLLLREYDEFAESYSGREIVAEITYITWPGMHGLPGMIGVMSISIISHSLTS